MGSARIARIVGLSDRFSANMRRELENYGAPLKELTSQTSSMAEMAYTVGVDSSLDLIRGLSCKSSKMVMW